MHSKINMLVENYVTVGNIKSTFEVKEGSYAIRGESGVEFSEAVVCTPMRKEAIQLRGELTYETMHEASEDDAFKHLAKT